MAPALDAATPIGIDGTMERLLNTPAMQKALREVQTNKLNALDETPVIQDAQALGLDGKLYGQSIHPEDLNIAKMVLDDNIRRIEVDPTSAEKFELRNLRDLRGRINGIAVLDEEATRAGIDGNQSVRSETALQSQQSVLQSHCIFSDQWAIRQYVKLRL